MLAVHTVVRRFRFVVAREAQGEILDDYVACNFGARVRPGREREKVGERTGGKGRSIRLD